MDINVVWHSRWQGFCSSFPLLLRQTFPMLSSNPDFLERSTEPLLDGEGQNSAMTGLVDKTHIRCRTNQTTEIHHPPLTISSTELKVQGHLNDSRSMTSLNNILRGWWQELLWLWISVLAFVILVVLLNAYDNQPLPQWPSGITLNTAVASLATIARTALTIPVAEGLSQSKRSWFKRKPRPLKDFDMFDQASRGPWGSLTLLVRTKGWHVCSNPSPNMPSLTVQQVHWSHRSFTAHLWYRHIHFDPINGRVFDSKCPNSRRGSCERMAVTFILVDPPKYVYQ